ncbi:hypothetical protein OG568_47330 [Streptomyces sp. NBC_01450]|uniref:hypothetical protein n=1 Tax=Streptomyces sp. NBC_01450 TaxID=2903871 RepID=UPI002E32D5F3|nr:hypothetical protein [Streptomyces sp. NBC_01450]
MPGIATRLNGGRRPTPSSSSRPPSANTVNQPDTGAVPVRDADGTHWLPRTEIQRLLSAGIRHIGQPRGSRP